ncbi:hypothetical protein RRG08_020508, partial [Elysia crispata]
MFGFTSCRTRCCSVKQGFDHKRQKPSLGFKMALSTLLALFALISYATSSLPPCGPSGRQCIKGRSECVGDNCECINPPYVWGDPYFMCYRKGEVAAECRNDPSLTTFNNETTNFPFPCRYLMTHIKQELKGRRRKVLGECEIKVHAFNKRGLGKVFTHGVDVAVKIKYSGTGTVIQRSVRKYGTASDGVNNFVVSSPDGPWTPPVMILYQDPPNKIELKCEENSDNNQLVLEFAACGIRITLVPYDIEDRIDQAQIPGLSVAVNCAH